ncbi:MAG: PAC2 family protein [Candidatus Woesearchaeota archaeon]
MEISIKRKVKNPIIIEGFPGFGLVGTIASEFLVEHLKTELIGNIFLDELPAMIAVHEGKIIQPIGIYYNKENNIIIISGISAMPGMEWKLADAVLKLARDNEAKEIVSIEGVGTSLPNEKPKTYYYADDEKNSKKLETLKLEKLREGIIVGVTGILLAKGEGIKRTAIFVETVSGLPDANAAAEAIKAIDGYLGLKVNYEPLKEQARKFEEKLKTILVKSMEAKEKQEQKQLSYVG